MNFGILSWEIMESLSIPMRIRHYLTLELMVQCENFCDFDPMNQKSGISWELGIAENSYYMWTIISYTLYILLKLEF